ncbi:amidohydrolase [Thermodesulforhabdus norvegica]|uniref:5-methylthioadenosine/S-adenosylhomocysteine deaminase n=1 Tax=Thermodesulforhabdus norvegica TaxID=39841 RepID=A0A1I4QHT4_9BACT|nr:amidohydrolase [Thermodesulforhabdus norvegica]SFM39639.1 5-methylthioadenosine/S-adenosylhomocysteine deaminase [Thermodesulforhabdus norvegica]
MHEPEVDVLITDGCVICLDENNSVFSPGYVAVHDGKIVGVGPGNPPEVFGKNAREIVKSTGCVVLPGLVNAHTHAAMTIFRGIADDLPLMEWLQKHIFPAESKLTEEWVYWGTLLGCAEMIAGGTTCFCDMYLFESAVAKAADESGMRALVGEVLYDFPSPNYGPPEKGILYTENLIKEWQGHGRVRIAVEPHATYTCSPELLRKCRELANRFEAPLVIHLSETLDEVEKCRSDYGCTPVEHLNRLGIFDNHTIAAHCVHLTDEDIRILQEKGVYAVHNPQSNLKLASGVSPLPKLMSSKVKVALGTDGPASNNDLDMFGEMDTCAKLHKAVFRDPTVLPARDVLALATINGAEALGFQRVGRLKEGFFADLIILDFRKPHLTPCYDPVSHLVYAVRSSDVRDVMVNGRWIFRNGEHITLDVEKISHHVKRIASQIKGS